MPSPCERRDVDLSAFILENSTIITNSSIRRLPLAFGDELAIGDVTFKLYPEEFGVEGTVSKSYLVPCLHSRYDFYKVIRVQGITDHHRSSEDKILINPPGAEPQS